MNFTGKYIGTLWYGAAYPEIQFGSELTFQMDIEEENNSFSGIAMDLEGIGKSPDEAVVVGMISESIVSFDKVYERYHYSDGEGNTLFDDKSEGIPIQYDGIFNLETGFYEGTWKYIAYCRYWIFFRKPIEIGSGTFKLKRA